MNLFIKKIASFLIVLIGYFGIVFLVNQLLIYYNPPMLPEKNILILGDSHTQRALNPEHLYSANNVSKTAEPYFISFWKLKKMLNNNNIDTLIFGFSYHNISAFNDKKLVDPQWSVEMFRRVYPIEHFRELKGVDVDFPSFYQEKMKRMCLYPHKNHTDYMGEYLNYQPSNVLDFEKVIKRHYFYNGENVGVSQLALSYLDSVINLCSKEEIELFLVKCPLHNNYESRVPVNFIKAFSDLSDDLTLKGVKIIVPDDENYFHSDFLNSDHLNRRGAEKFTIEIQKKLRASKDSLY